MRVYTPPFVEKRNKVWIHLKNGSTRINEFFFTVRVETSAQARGRSADLEQLNVLNVGMKIDLVLVRLTWRTFVEVSQSIRDCAIESNGCRSRFPTVLFSIWATAETFKFHR